MYEICAGRFGFAVLAIKRSPLVDDWAVGCRTLTLWGSDMPDAYVVTSDADHADWVRQCNEIETHWPGLMTPELVRANGHDFVKVVKVDATP